MAKKQAYIEFVEVKDTGKTKVYNIRNIKFGDVLGLVAWYPAWRRYVFQPIDSKVLFDATCLTQIAEFIESLMAERKEGS